MAVLMDGRGETAAVQVSRVEDYLKRNEQNLKQLVGALDSLIRTKNRLHGSFPEGSDKVEGRPTSPSTLDRLAEQADLTKYLADQFDKVAQTLAST